MIAGPRPFQHSTIDPVQGSIAALCALALLVRLFAFSQMPGPINADEDFQYLEQAHRIAYGTGLVPWEYVIGIRSWILPGLLSPAFALGRLLNGDPRIAIWLIALCLSILSLPIVACSMLWANRAMGLMGAIGAGAATATWFEIAAFAPHALADTVAASLLVPGLYLSGVGRPLPDAKRRLAGCLLLGCTIVIRLQLMPVAVIACAWCAWRGGMRQAIAGLTIPLVVSGCVDALTLSYPFQSSLKYIWVNLILGGARSYGSLPWYGYFAIKLVFWSFLSLPLTLLVVVGAARLRVVALFACAVLLPFVLLAHKEDRFVYAALPLLFTLAGAGSAALLATLTERAGGKMPHRIAGIALVVVWSTMSAWAGSNAKLWHYLYQFPAINGAVAQIDRDPQACGVAMHPKEPWARTPGSARLWPGVKLYGYTNGDPLSRTGAFDYVIDSPGDKLRGVPGFTRVACWDTPTEASWPDRWIAHACLWHRSGGCDSSASPPLTLPLPSFLTSPR